jgi:large subunit ribosomal protein L13
MTEKNLQHVIDASGKRLGRVASEVATILMGKDQSDAVKNIVIPVSVKVENVSRLIISEKKRNETEYTFYSGYPGGLRKVSMQKIIDKKGVSEVFRKAVYGMLPSNRLRTKRMKNLTISE